MEHELECVTGKKTFLDKDSARKRAKEINIENKSNNDPTTLRCYKCEHCGNWHLTSWSVHGFNWSRDMSYRNSIREKKFIKRESEYWMKKFGVDA